MLFRSGGKGAVRYLPNPVRQLPPVGGHAPQAQHFVTVGRLAHQKGHDIAIRAFRQVVDRFPQATFAIVGDGPEHQALAARLMRRLKEKNIGILAIVHDLNFASQLADTMVFMDAGRVVASGTPEEVMTPETIRRIFKIEASIVTHPVSAAPYAIV